MPPAFFLSRFALALLFAPLAAGAQLRVQDASVLAGTCLNCHGPEGRSAGAIPSLHGHTAGYLLQRQDDAHAVLDAVGSPHLKVQMDLYHCQIVEGDLATKLRRYLPTGRVGHVQMAGVPERHEPDQGEVYYPYLFGLIDALGYGGWIGCEYRPRAGTSAGLGWRP